MPLATATPILIASAGSQRVPPPTWTTGPPGRSAGLRRQHQPDGRLAVKDLVGEPVEGDLQVAWAAQRCVLPIWRRIFEQTRGCQAPGQLA